MKKQHYKGSQCYWDYRTTFLGLVLFVALFWSNKVFAQLPSGGSHQQAMPKGVLFTANQNQWRSDVRYIAELPNARLYVQPNRLVYQLMHPEDVAELHHYRHHRLPNGVSPTVRMHFLNLLFEGGANPNPIIDGECAAPFYRNYFEGNDSTKWASKVPLYAQTTYRDIYSGIDFRLYSTENHLKYDLIVAPHAKPADIQLRYEGADNIFIDDGSLHILTSTQNLVEQKPYAYQYCNGKEIPVPCRFVLSGQRLGFEFPQGYDTESELIIDPEIIFSTFTGSNGDNWGFTATYDAGGNLYAGGILVRYEEAFLNGNYPTTGGAFQTSFAGGSGDLKTDIVITKFSPQGNSLVYSTHLGGNSNEIPQSLIVDSNNQLIVFGSTSSSNFPTSNAYDNSFNGGNNVEFNSLVFPSGSDIILTKFNATGSGLVASTYVGGSSNDGLNLDNTLSHNYADEGRGEVFLDSSGNIYVASSTYSSNFPIVSGAFQPSLSGNQDACLFKMNAGLNTLIYSTFIGGSGADAAYSVKLDAANNAYVCGGTRSNNFPVTNGSLDNTHNGGSADGFLVKINATASSLLAGTFLGTNDYDQAFLVELDEDENVYTVGQTEGNYAVVGSVYNNPNSGQFIHKLNNNLSATIFSTVFGNGNGHPNISPTAFLVDICNRIYVSGWGGETNGGNSTTSGLPVTGNAYQGNTDGSDFYFIVLREDASSLEYATFFGGVGNNDYEHVDGGTSRFDKAGVIYQAVCAGCGGTDNFPTTPGAWSSSNNSSNCNLAAIKFNFDPPFVLAEAAASPSTSGCAPLTVNFDNTSFNATEYTWIFENGQTSSQFEPSYTFTTPGQYTVYLIADKPGACNEADTTSLVIDVFPPISLSPSFTYTVDCATRTVQVAATPQANVDYSWNFGDNTTGQGQTTSHTYSGTGDFTITLTEISTLPNCSGSGSTQQTISIQPGVTSGILANPNPACLGDPVTFSNLSTFGDTYVWNLGDGSPTSTSFVPPPHTYTQVGDYTVSLTVTNPLSCNGSATATYLLTILDTIITAQFTPILPGVCDPQIVAFNTPTNDLLGYHWDFGDGQTSSESDPQHLYATAGTYEVTLILSSDCAPSDTLTQTIVLPPQPLVDGDIIQLPESGCVPVSITVAGTGNGTSYVWDFGDGTTAQGLSATHTYSEVGDYTLLFVAQDPNTCNLADTTSTVVSVYGYAVASFAFAPVTAEVGQEVVFTNTSSNADSYIWDFGDGSPVTTTTNPTHIFAADGEYSICLQALNEEHCDDEVCLPIAVVPPIFIGVPNAFTPNGDNLNDVLFVEGRDNISEMLFRVYNRWGELVFEAADPQIGWNGVYKEQPQDMDVFVYTLSATLISNRKLEMQGNITLLR